MTTCRSDTGPPPRRHRGVSDPPLLLPIAAATMWEIRPSTLRNNPGNRPRIYMGAAAATSGPGAIPTSTSPAGPTACDSPSSIVPHLRQRLCRSICWPPITPALANPLWFALNRRTTPNSPATANTFRVQPEFRDPDDPPVPPPPTAITFAERIVAHLRSAGPTSHRALRATLRVRDQSLSAALRALETAGRITRTPHGWTAVH